MSLLTRSRRITERIVIEAEWRQDYVTAAAGYRYLAALDALFACDDEAYEKYRADIQECLDEEFGR